MEQAFNEAFDAYIKYKQAAQHLEECLLESGHNTDVNYQLQLDNFFEETYAPDSILDAEGYNEYIGFMDYVGANEDPVWVEGVTGLTLYPVEET
jgi:hypothetical protein